MPENDDRYLEDHSLTGGALSASERYRYLNDAAVAALLDAEAAARGGQLAVEQIDGHWRAGFIEQTSSANP